MYITYTSTKQYVQYGTRAVAWRHFSSQRRLSDNVWVVLRCQTLHSDLLLKINAIKTEIKVHIRKLQLHVITWNSTNFDVLLTVHLSIFILVINRHDAQNFVLQQVYFMPLTCFKQHVLIVRRSKLYYTASGIITLCKWPSGAQVQTVQRTATGLM